VRINTGMARCNRAHLRSSFLGEMRRTYLDHLERYQPRQPHLRGQTSERSQAAWNRSKPRHRHGDYRSNFPARESYIDYRSYQKSATFFASVPVWGCFQLTV
jgi:hypothetical protein